MYELKRVPEDFKVIEKSKVKIKESGNYLYFKLWKKKYNTVDAIKRIASGLHINSKKIGYAGNKDRHAITEQICSVRDISEKKLNDISLNKDIQIKIIGRGDVPISLGFLEGNYFIINIYTNEEPVLKNEFINYFGEQRFGMNNIAIGRAIIKNDLNSLRCILNTDDPIKKLSSENKKISRFYIHAYQSYIWNLTVENLLEKNIRVDKVPLIGFGTEIIDLRVKKIITEIMKTEGITFRDFIIRKIPDLSSEGDERDMYVKAQDVELLKKDGYFTIKFFLEKGCYATTFIKQLFK